MKNTLVLSWNPVPMTRGNAIVSATGMRCYKLACGLIDNGIRQVDIAVRNFEKDSGTCQNEKIGILEWNSDEQICEITANYSTIILNPGYGESAEYILENIPKTTKKIIDLFIPYYFDDAFTHSNQEDYDDAQHSKSMIIFHKCINSADYLLVASEAQKNMYLGAMGALDMINYNNFLDYKDNILVTPPGLLGEKVQNSNPYEAYSKEINGRKVLVWYGSLYKWDNAEPILKAFSENSPITKEYVLFVLGATNPDFKTDVSQQYREDSNKHIIWVPWVKYEERLSWLKNADIGASYNKLTIENRFSFRNRLLDYIEADLPFITNGEDPLGESAIASGFALKITDEIDVNQLNLAQKLGKNYTSDAKRQYLNEVCHEPLKEALLAEYTPALNSDYFDISSKTYNALNKKLRQAEVAREHMAGEIEIKAVQISKLEADLVDIQAKYNNLPKTTKQFVKRSIKTRLRK